MKTSVHRPTIALIGSDSLCASVATDLKERKWKVQSASRDNALECVRKHAPDLVALFDEGSPQERAALLNLFALDPVAAIVPVVIVSPNADLSEKLDAFRAGAIETISPEVGGDGVVTRIIKVLEELPKREGEIVGTVGETSLNDFVNLLSERIRAGIVSIHSQHADTDSMQLIIGSGADVSKTLEDFIGRLRPLVAKKDVKYSIQESLGERLQFLEADAKERAPLSTFESVRIALFGSKNDDTETLGSALVEHGASVTVHTSIKSELDSLDRIDPDVLICTDELFKVEAQHFFRSLHKNRRLRWATLVIIQEETWSKSLSSSAGLERIAGKMQAALAPLRDLQVRAKVERAFDTRLALLGPSRVLRALSALPDAFRLSIVNEAEESFELETKAGMLLGAAGKVSGHNLVVKDALRAFIGLSRGRLHIEKVESTKFSNIMLPVEQALELRQSISPTRPRMHAQTPPRKSVVRPSDDSSPRFGRTMLGLGDLDTDKAPPVRDTLNYPTQKAQRAEVEKLRSKALPSNPKQPGPKLPSPNSLKISSKHGITGGKIQTSKRAAIASHDDRTRDISLPEPGLTGREATRDVALPKPRRSASAMRMPSKGFREDRIAPRGMNKMRSFDEDEPTTEMAALREAPSVPPEASLDAEDAPTHVVDPTKVRKKQEVTTAKKPQLIDTQQERPLPSIRSGGVAMKKAPTPTSTNHSQPVTPQPMTSQPRMPNRRDSGNPFSSSGSRGAHFLADYDNEPDTELDVNPFASTMLSPGSDARSPDSETPVHNPVAEAAAVLRRSPSTPQPEKSPFGSSQQSDSAFDSRSASHSPFGSPPNDDDATARFGKRALNAELEKPDGTEKPIERARERRASVSNIPAAPALTESVDQKNHGVEGVTKRPSRLVPFLLIGGVAVSAIALGLAGAWFVASRRAKTDVVDSTETAVKKNDKPNVVVAPLISKDGGSPQLDAKTATQTVVASDAGVKLDSSAQNTNAPDAEIANNTPDTGVADAVVDTAVADTAVADTAVADTAVADTAVADTAVADTAVADTATKNLGSETKNDESQNADEALAVDLSGNAESLAAKAIRHLRRKQIKEARLLLDAAVKKDETNSKVLRGMTELALIEKDATAALEWAQKAVSKRPKRAHYQLLLGDAYKLSGDEANARKAWNKAIELDPKSPATTR